MINKGLILKTAAVVSAVSVLIITGCQGGNKETAAVNNKSVVKETSIVSEKDREEDIETVVRSNGLTRQDTEDLRDDNKRETASDRRLPEVTVEVKQPEDEGAVTGENDSGTSDGAEDASDADDEYSGEEEWGTDTSSVDSYSDLWDGEYTDNGVAEAGYSDTAGAEEAEGSGSEIVSELVESEYEQSYEESDGYYDSGDGGAGYSEESGANLIYLDTWTISFYCPCVACTNSGNGITASGTYAQPWHTAATDGLEFGTTLYVDGLGYFVVEDRGTSYGWLDIFVADHNEALNLGLQYRDVYLVN